MTPKEKARELRNKMYLKIPSIYDPTMLLHYPIAKEMALVAVNEILSWNQTKFWEDVKEEIEKL